MTASRLRSFVESLRDGEQNNSNLTQHLQVFLFHSIQIPLKSYKFSFIFLSIFFELHNTVVMLSLQILSPFFDLRHIVMMFSFIDPLSHF